MKRVSIAATLLLLAGCGPKVVTAPPPIVVPTKVVVPEVGPCVPANLPSSPSYPDTRETLRAAKDAAERYHLMGAGWPLRDQRLKELEIVVAGCPKAEK